MDERPDLLINVREKDYVQRTRQVFQSHEHHCFAFGGPAAVSALTNACHGHAPPIQPCSIPGRML